jgi:isopenicillin-N N-acyltransferase like protein
LIRLNYFICTFIQLMVRFKKILLKLFKILAGIFVLLLLLFMFFLWRIQIPNPQVNTTINPSSFTRKQVAPDSYSVNNCWLKKNKFGIWEMYLEGDDYERGVIYGVLAKELIEKQEVYFVDQINEIVPNRFYQFFLKLFVAWFNKDIYKYVPDENLREIYGVSLSFSDKYDYIGPKYYRILNYHAAHDIGHALNDFSLVGCTSFAVNKKYSADSTLLIGRNFDFDLGKDFAKDKLLVFVNPTHGYKYASYSWAGFTGVVSGMNEKGVTVTINASKSDIPHSAKDPISLLAREILQYAKNISEAIAIAKKRETFVSESLLIGSAADDRAIIIEKSPEKFDVYEPNNDVLVCANHYQGKTFIYDSINIKNIENSDSRFRYERMNQLLEQNFPVSVNSAVEILRNKEGLDGKNIGYGNPQSLNQMIAHHGIVFKPAGRKFWVSACPYQMGEFVCYDLMAVFNGNANFEVDSLNIKPDTFLNTVAYSNYEKYKTTKRKLRKFTTLGVNYNFDEKNIADFINDNPDCYITYMALGDYFKKLKQYEKAHYYYSESLKHTVASQNESEIIKQNIEACKKILMH